MDKSERKRSRPDSLSYKNTGDENIVTPKTTEKVKTSMPQMDTSSVPAGSRKDGIPRTGYASYTEAEILKALGEAGKLESHQNQKVPVVQWIVVLLALGLGAYYLKKSLVGAPAKRKAAASRDTFKLEQVIREFENDGDEKPSKKPVARKPASAKKKRSKQKTSSKPFAAKAESALSTSVTKGTSTSVDPPSAVDATNHDAGEWQTVGAANKKPQGEASVSVNESQPPNGAVTTAGTKKKNKTAAAAEKTDASPQSDAPADTETDDAALAQALQNEENGLPAAAEEEWEEVGTKKKGGKRKG